MTDTPPSVNAFALTAETKQKTLKDIDRCCSLFYVAMASIYNVAQSAMVDAHAFLRQHLPTSRRSNAQPRKRSSLTKGSTKPFSIPSATGISYGSTSPIM